MKKLIALLLFCLSLHGQGAPTWTNQTPNATWPAELGWIGYPFDLVSNQWFLYAANPSYSGTASVTIGSPTVNWVSGPQWNNWLIGDTFSIDGNNVTILTVSATSITLTANYSGATSGTVPWFASTGGIFSKAGMWYDSNPGGNFNKFSTSFNTYSLSDSCPADLPHLPGDSHRQPSIIDTTRHFMYFGGGVNVNCGQGLVDTNGTAVTVQPPSTAIGHHNSQLPIDGTLNGKTITINGVNYTVASVSDVYHLTLTTSAGVQTGVVFGFSGTSSGNPRQDWYYMPLQATPSSDVPTQLLPAHFPGGSFGYPTGVYSPDDDTIFIFSGDGGGETNNNWVYCSTQNAGTGIPSGVLSAAQKTAGCDPATGGNGPDDWSLVCPPPSTLVSGSCTGSFPTQPPGVYHGGALYDPIIKKVIFWGGTSSGLTTTYNQTWWYDIPTHTWTQKCGGGCTNPPNYTGPSQVNTPSFAYVNGKVYMHQGNTYGGTQPSDWVYDPGTDIWTLLQTGVGTIYDSFMAYNPNINSLITYAENVSNATEMQIGLLGGEGSGINVPLTVMEELPIGALGVVTACASTATCGVARTNEPFTMGIPLPDNDVTGTNTTSVLGLTGCSAGQFRPVVTWPSGRFKWLEVSGIVPSMSAGGTATCTLVGTGSGNFGGSDLATDAGSTISVATGTSSFSVKKANFNMIDTAVVGSTTILSTSSSATRGLVLTGPANPNTDCTGGCTTQYTSANDSGSTCSIEENGPVKTVLKCMGNLESTGGANTYMHHTTRLTFWKSKNGVKVHNELRNADLNSSSFNTAYKGFASYESRLDIAPSTPNVFEFGGASGAVTGTIAGSNNAVLLQQYSNRMEADNGPGIWNTTFIIALNSTQSIIPRSQGGGCTDFACYPDATRVNEGYTILNNTTNLETGTRSDYPTGYCDAKTSGGAGLLQGFWYFGAYWPKSCELNNGGSNMVLGIWPKGITGGLTYWTPWPQYQINDYFYVFHDSALSSDLNSFLGLQYPLIARYGRDYLNGSGVLPPGMALADPTAEDAFYTSIAVAQGISTSFACCPSDGNTTIESGFPNQTRSYAQGQGSDANQAELKWADLLLFQTRGFTGRYLWAEMFYRFTLENALARSDFSGGWRGSGATLTATGFPTDASSNSAASLRNWIDRLHAHYYGIFDWYGMTGDGSVLDGIQQGFYDWLTNATLTINYADGPQRALGVLLMATNRLHDFALGIGDPTDPASGLKISDEAWTLAQLVMTSSVNPVMTSGITGGNPCAVANCAGGSGTGDYGSDANRGVSWFQGAQTQWDNPPATGPNNPGGVGTSRNSGQLQEGILEEGIMEYMMNRGTGWADYEKTRDILLGNSFFVRNEWTVTGQSPQLANGTRTGAALDYCNDPASPCSAGVHNSWAVFTGPNAFYYTMAPFHQFFGDTIWRQSYVDNLIQDYFSTGCAHMSECGIYSMSSLTNRYLNAPAPLSDLTVTGFVDNGGGSYTLSWTVPNSTTGYLFKWGPQAISYNLGFDNGQAMTYVQNPATHTTWWAANNVGSEPAPGTPGSTQSYTFSTGVSGLNVTNFALKAMAPGGAPPTAGGSMFSGASKFRGGVVIR